MEVVVVLYCREARYAPPQSAGTQYCSSPTTDVGKSKNAVAFFVCCEKHGWGLDGSWQKAVNRSWNGATVERVLPVELVVLERPEAPPRRPACPKTAEKLVFECQNTENLGISERRLLVY